MSITIRDAFYNDAKEIAKVQNNSQKNVEYKDFSDKLKEEILLSREDLYRIWLGRLFNDSIKTFVACDDEYDYICGVIAVQNFCNCNYIRSLYIDPNYVHQKIGSSLLETVIKYSELKKVKTVRLEVLEENIIARKFYLKYGFIYHNFEFPKELGGTAQNLFPNKEHLVLQMEKKLF
ncbi:MAG: GNAT family N-acetyltransferase [Succinivibrionaceae bacterium]